MEKIQKTDTSTTEMVSISRAEYDALKAQNAELSQKLDYLMEQMRLTKKKVYSASSEKSNTIAMTQHCALVSRENPPTKSAVRDR